MNKNGRVANIDFKIHVQKYLNLAIFLNNLNLNIFTIYCPKYILDNKLL